MIIKKMKFNIIASRLLISGFVLSMLNGCYYDNVQELHRVTVCDTSGTISFAGDILPILNNSCGAQNAACHTDQSSTSGYGLANYADVIFTINDAGDFLQTITHDPSINSSKWMPKDGGKLDACSIQKIEAWLNRGRLNN